MALDGRMTKRATLSIVLVATAGAIACTLWVSLDPDYYFFYTEAERATWRFSLGHVLTVSGIMLIVATICGAAFLCARPEHLWLRSLLALVMLVPWALYTTRFVIHVPGYVLIHHLWVWVNILALVAAAAVSATMHVVSIGRRRRVAV